jgi:signal transduction histidine kinase
MTRILNLDDLQDRIIREVSSILRVESATLMLFDPGEGRYTIRCSFPADPGASLEHLAPNNIIIDKIDQDRTLIVKDELRRMLPGSEYEPFETEFERMDAEVFIPLFHRDELHGLLLLGEKSSSDIFSREDLNLLATLGNQAAVALENALLHHKVTVLMRHNESILKHMSSGVIATDPDRSISTCNDKARETLRLMPVGSSGLNLDMLPPPLEKMLSATLDGDTTYSNHEIEILNDRSELAYLNAATSLLKDETGKVTGALLVFNDLTEIKLLQSEMWRADKLASLGTLAAGMAHEIKNPLVAIKTFAQLLPTRFEDEDFRDTFSTITIGEVERINSIVEKLLEFARPSAPMFESLDIIEVIGEVLLLLTPEFDQHGVTLTKNFQNGSALMIGDKGQLKQTLLNLCLNAMQAMQHLEPPVEKKLSIGVEFRKKRHRETGDSASEEASQVFHGSEVAASADDAETIIIRVRDRGRGIERKELSRIFDPFFTTRKHGVGLGLAVVHGIIKEHRGSITVDSEKDSGTEFTISLPVGQLFVKEKV